MNRLLLLLLCVSFFSCNDINYKDVHPAIANYLKNNLHDPNSFEYIEQNRNTLDGQVMELYMNNTDRSFKYESFDKPYLKDELDKIFSPDSTYGHIYFLTYRAKNSYGALVKSTKRFAIGNNDELFGLIDEDDKEINEIYNLIVSPKVKELRNKMN